ncbi:hemerythrin [Hylemonella gracilis str. Niagara R]|uniref:Hemerythrin n=1 Tax=Hylemonella gracilis str. Niagara R TaxID=1458275 RepID=A0A016XJA5_9BURK|nr:hemerythrin domain-containing protein [Hylemonella gracilis]EYC51931.1 hemerythrin [Hylemonella gracilis str. Niagara R]
MIASKKTTAPSRTPAQAGTGSQDAIALLRADHAEVSALFADYEKPHTNLQKKALVSRICAALNVHTQIEEELFYPAIKNALKDKLLVPEAVVEHTGIKRLIGEIEGAEPDGEMFDAKVKVLSEYVKHHVKEEQGDMFPKVRGMDIDMQKLGAQMHTRKAQLLAAAG